MSFAQIKLKDSVEEKCNRFEFVKVLKPLCYPPLERNEAIQGIVIKTIAEHPSLLIP
jgi:hypothetical protein